LDSYLRETASQDVKKRSAIVYILTDNDHEKIYGYYTLTASSAPLGEVPSEIAKKLPKYPNVPVTLIGRMAVARDQQRKGYGELLLMDALQVSFKNSLSVASAAIVVDAKDEASATFYHKFGFIPLESRPLRLFMPMKTVESLVLDS
jgi:predicted GNAT family N-acyltransferase